MNCKQLKHTLVKLKMKRMRRCEMATWGKRLENLRENGQKQRSSVWTLRLCVLPWTLKPIRSHYHRHNPQWQLPWWEWTQTLLRSSDFIHFQGNFQERSFHWLNHRHKRAPELLRGTALLRFHGRVWSPFSSIVYQGSPQDRKGLEMLDRQKSQTFTTCAQLGCCDDEVRM